MTPDTAQQETLELTPQQLFRKQAAGEAILPNEEDSVHRHVITVLIGGVAFGVLGYFHQALFGVAPGQ